MLLPFSDPSLRVLLWPTAWRHQQFHQFCSETKHQLSHQIDKPSSCQGWCDKSCYVSNYMPQFMVRMGLRRRLEMKANRFIYNEATARFWQLKEFQLGNLRLQYRQVYRWISPQGKLFKTMLGSWAEGNKQVRWRHTGEASKQTYRRTHLHKLLQD